MENQLESGCRGRILQVPWHHWRIFFNGNNQWVWSTKYHSSVLVRSMVPYKKIKGETEAGNHLRRRVRRHGIFASENVDCHAKHFITLWAGIGYHWFCIVDILYVENIGKTSLKTHAHEEKNDSNCSLVCTNESNSYLLWFFDRWQ